MLTRDFLVNADCKTAFGAIEESLHWSRTLSVAWREGRAGDSEFILTREVFPRTDLKCQHFVRSQRPLRQLDQRSDFHTVNQRQGGDTTPIRTGFA